MNSFMVGFLNELSKHASFKDTVHHPVTQAIGYAALAGEGIHLLEDAKRPRLQKFYKGKLGRGVRTGSLGIGSAFLAAEALAALGDVFSKKRKKKVGKGPDVIIKVQAPEPRLPKVRFGRIPKVTTMSLRKLTKAIGFKR